MVLMVAGMMGFQFVTALYLQRVLGLGALGTGLAFLPAPVMIAVFSLGLSAKLSVRFSASVVLVAGLAVVVAAFGLLTAVPAQGSYFVHALPALVLMGSGAGAAIPAVMGLAMSGADPADSGVASGLITTTQQVGAAIGTAVLATAAATRTAGLVAEGTTAREALASGYRLAYGLSAGFVLLAAVVAALVLSRPPRPAAAPELCVADQAR